LWQGVAWGCEPRPVTLRSADCLSRESGSTLIGELVGVAILGMAFVILLGAISTGMKGTAVVEQQVVAQNLAQAQLETIKAADYQANPYPTVSVSGPYSVTVAVTYWMSSTGRFTTVLQTPDSGLQRITVTVSCSGEPVTRLEGFKVER